MTVITPGPPYITRIASYMLHNIHLDTDDSKPKKILDTEHLTSPEDLHLIIRSWKIKIYIF